MHKYSIYLFRVTEVKALMKSLGLTEAEIASRLFTAQTTVHRTVTNKAANRITQNAIVAYLIRAARQRKIKISVADLLVPSAEVGSGTSRMTPDHPQATA